MIQNPSTSFTSWRWKQPFFFPSFGTINKTVYFTYFAFTRNQWVSLQHISIEHEKGEDGTMMLSRSTNLLAQDLEQDIASIRQYFIVLGGSKINNLDYSITSLGIFHISSFPSSKLNSRILNKKQSIKADEKHALMYTNMQKFLKPLLLTICDQY